MGRGNPAFFMPGEQPTARAVHKGSSELLSVETTHQEWYLTDREWMAQ